MTEDHTPSRQDVPIAVIGMGCLFPKAPGLKEYWRLIARGQDAIDEVPGTHWSPADYFHPDPKRPDHVYCTRGGYLTPVSFDPTEFGIPPASIEATDTSQLLGLLAARIALEDAGYGNGPGIQPRTRPASSWESPAPRSWSSPWGPGWAIPSGGGPSRRPGSLRRKRRR